MKRIIHGGMCDDNQEEEKPDFNPLFWFSLLFSVVMLTIALSALNKYEREKESGVSQEPAITGQASLITIQSDLITVTPSMDVFDRPQQDLIDLPIIVEKKEILPEYKDLYEANNDMRGYIFLPEGNSYPVMQRVLDQNYYLDKNFHEEYDKEGIPFLNRYSELGEPGISLIYGHTLKNGNQFGKLKYFEDKDYFEKHHTIRIDTLYKEITYEVVAVALTSLSEDFEYYSYVGSISEAEFNDWKSGFEKYCVRGSLQGLSHGDIIVELSACAYHVKDGRIVIILKAVS